MNIYVFINLLEHIATIYTGLSLFVFSNNLINYAVYFYCMHVLQIHQDLAYEYPK